MVSDQRSKDPAHIANGTDTGAALKIPSMRYYEMYDMLGPLNLC